MTLLSLINLWSISTSHCGLTYHPFGPSQPSFGLKMAQMVQPRTQLSLMLSSINESIHSISTQLLTQLQRGDTVVILRSPGLELVEIIFGCQRAGLLCIPVFPPDPKENYHHLVRVLSQTKPKAAIAHHD
ncbi:hypothetical protein NC651_014324 [Populus alba x Populus x berolinensis]|nr:hypothetical protein NC651_014324 [Populus alba x Populus x berolinensis]